MAAYDSFGNEEIEYSANTLYLVCKNTTISDSVTTIGRYAFYNMEELTSIHLPANVTKIEVDPLTKRDLPWYNCPNIQSITVDSSNAVYRSANNGLIERSTNMIIQGCRNTIISSDVTSIRQRAFIDCKGLTEITIPANVTEIGYYAFFGCDDIEAVVLEGLTVLPTYLFSSTRKKPKIYVSLDWYHNVSYKGSEKSLLATYDIVSSGSTASSRFEYIFDSANKQATLDKMVNEFKTSATDVVLPDFVFVGTDRYPITRVENGFSFLNSTITSLVVGNNVESIGEIAFDSCKNLKSLKLPNSLKSIEAEAFSSTAITSITIPKNVTSIGTYALSITKGSSNVLTDITFEGEQPPTTIGDRIFGLSLTIQKIINVPEGCVSAYKKALSQYTECFVVDASDSVNEADTSFTFTYANNEATVTGIKAGITITQYTKLQIPKYVTSGGIDYLVTEIGALAFSNRSSLNSITIPNSVKTIGESAFSNCSSLTSITIPESVTTIVENAFNGCSGLSSINIPASVKVINGSAFAGCSALETITVASGNIKYTSSWNDTACNVIMERASKKIILGCANSTIPGDAEKIGSNAFVSSESTMRFPSNITSIDSNAFTQCAELKYVIILAQSITINPNVFNPSLVVLQIGSDKESGTVIISDSAFIDYTALQTVNIFAKDIQIGETAFTGSGVANLTLEYSSLTVGNYAFMNCVGLKSFTDCSWATTKFGLEVFSGSGLTNFTMMGKSMLSVGLLFKGCAAGSVTCTFNTGWCTIDVGCFQGCEALKTLTINSQSWITHQR